MTSRRASRGSGLRSRRHPPPGGPASPALPLAVRRCPDVPPLRRPAAGARTLRLAHSPGTPGGGAGRCLAAGLRGPWRTLRAARSLRRCQLCGEPSCLDAGAGLPVAGGRQRGPWATGSNRRAMPPRRLRRRQDVVSALSKTLWMLCLPFALEDGLLQGPGARAESDYPPGLTSRATAWRGTWLWRSCRVCSARSQRLQLSR